MAKDEGKRRVLNYVSIFVLVIFNLMVAFFLIYTGKKLVKNTKDSGALKVSPEIMDQIGN